MPDPLSLLTFSSLYPNAAMPRHGVFVEQRLRHLLATGEVRTRVIAPVPWFPFRHPVFRGYADFARVPRKETRHDVHIDHPRFVRIPKMAMSSAPLSMALGTIGIVRNLLKEGYNFDVIDAHYFYPDGVAAALLAKWFRKPLLITARGTDLNLIPQYRMPRKMIQWAAGQADGLITVCSALKDVLVELGVPEQRITVLRNGVDLIKFRPVERHLARRELDLPLDDTILLSVGLLIDRKGHDIPIRALAELPDVRLLIAGEGEKRRQLEELSEQSGVSERVKFLGGVPHDVLRTYFSAADASVLASSREGWANVLLESMACGTPVIATNVWGTPEVVSTPAAGVLMNERTPESFLEAFGQLMSNYPSRSDTRRYAEQFSWDETTQGQLDLMRRVAGRS